MKGCMLLEKLQSRPPAGERTRPGLGNLQICLWRTKKIVLTAPRFDRSQKFTAEEVQRYMKTA